MPDFDFSSFHKICSIGDGIKYVEMNNTVGQRWYIPLKNSKTHLSLFQPSSDKGKIIIKLFNIRFFTQQADPKLKFYYCPPLQCNTQLKL